MHDFYNVLINVALGIFALWMGLTYLLVPYDALKKKRPRLKSYKAVKTLGVAYVLLGVTMIVLGIQGVI